MHRPDPIRLKAAFKQYCHDQDKIMTPEETVERFKRRLALNNLDILEDITRIDNGRLGIPVYFSICGPEARAVIGNYKQMGKGATPAQAQASAVMELGERFSLFCYLRDRKNYLHGPQAELKEPSLDFEYIAQSVGDTSGDLEVLSELFAQLPLNWCWADNLTSGETTMLPFNWFWTINQFNGSCAGNCIEEALCQGICEVVERHVCCLISRDQIKTPRIRVESIHDPVAKELIGRFKTAGVELCLSDFTLAMGIPSVGALAWDPGTFPSSSEIVWTAGTTPSATKALCRALTEVAQLAGDFNSGGNYVASGLPKFQRLEAARYVTDPGRTAALQDLPELGDKNIKIEVQNCIDALAQRNMDLFVVDIRHAVLDIPAFYTIIPGAQFRERAAHSSVGMIMAKIVTESNPAQEALKKLQDMDARLPGKYYLQFYIGQVHLNQGDYQTAIDFLNKALRLEPPTEDMAAVYTYLGLCHKELEQYSTALEALEKGHAIDIQRTDTLNLLGYCHFKMQAHDQAIDCFRKLIAIDPSSAIDYANIAANYRAMGEDAKAVEYYHLALSLDSEIEFAREHLAQLVAKQ